MAHVELTRVFQVLDYEYTEGKYDILIYKYQHDEPKSIWVRKNFKVVSADSLNVNVEPLFINGFYRAGMSVFRPFGLRTVVNRVFMDFQKAHNFDSKFLP